MRAQEHDTTSSAECQWKNLYEVIKREKQEALRRLLDLQVRINGMEQQMKEMMVECEKCVEEVHRQRTEAEEQYQTMLTQIEGYMAEQERTVEHWKRCFSQLAALANEAIDGVPRMLAEAESSLFFFNLPREVKIFIEHCKGLVAEMKNMISYARK